MLRSCRPLSIDSARSRAAGAHVGVVFIPSADDRLIRLGKIYGDCDQQSLTPSPRLRVFFFSSSFFRLSLLPIPIMILPTALFFLSTHSGRPSIPLRSLLNDELFPTIFFVWQRLRKKRERKTLRSMHQIQISRPDCVELELRRAVLADGSAPAALSDAARHLRAVRGESVKD